MISKTTVSAIRHLLREGKLSQRKIALHLGVSRNTVRNVDKESVKKRRKRPSAIPEARIAAAVVAAPLSNCRASRAKSENRKRNSRKGAGKRETRDFLFPCSLFPLLLFLWKREKMPSVRSLR